MSILSHSNGEFRRTSTRLQAESPYFHGFDIMGALPGVLDRHSFDKLFLVTDPAVGQLYGEDVMAALRLTGRPAERLLVDEGEDNKDFRHLAQLCETLVERQVSKDSILLALGGGVVGNIVGLAAAMIYRGIRFVEMPTTVMGQTDSTLSNKQAVNGRRGKNHFGVYYAPLFIWADRRFLLTEPPHTARGGLVEAVKNGFISDPVFLDYIGTALDGRWPVERERLDEFIPRIIDSKLAILERDPSERKLGVILEYGHTFGHAIESLERGAVPHGEAVGIGMCLAAELSRELGLCTHELVGRHYRVLRERVGIPVRMPAGITPEALLARMASDNKKTSRGVRHVLLEDVGRIHNPEGDYQTVVDPALVGQVIDAFIRREGTYVPPGAPAELAYA